MEVAGQVKQQRLTRSKGRQIAKLIKLCGTLSLRGGRRRGGRVGLSSPERGWLLTPSGMRFAALSCLALPSRYPQVWAHASHDHTIDIDEPVACERCRYTPGNG